MLDTLGRDIRIGFRALRKRPGFALLAISTLSLGVGGTAALFSVANRLLLRPLPYPDDSRLVTFWSPFDWRGVEFDLVRERPGVYENISAYTTTSVTLRGDAGAQLVESLDVSAEFFRTLAVAPALGRGFEDGEDRVGAEPVVVLSHNLWTRELGGEPGILGTTLTMNGTTRRVVGVMPPDFFFPSPDVRVWVPLLFDPTSGDYEGNGYLALIGRLAPDVTATRADQDLALLTTQLGERFNYPEAWDKTRNASLTPVREYLFGEVGPALVLLLGAVAFILVMAISNVSILVLGRVSDRRREMGVRTALGATRARVVRQVLTESLMLGLISGAGGVLLAVVSFRLILDRLPLGAGFAESLSLEWTLVWMSLGLALVVGFLVGLAPIHALVRGGLGTTLRGTRAEGGGGSGSGLQTGFVAFQVALAVILVAGAGLLIRSVSSLQSLETGVDPEGVLTLELFAAEGDLGPSERAAFLDEIVTRVAALPGVTSAGAIHRLPLRDDGSQGPMMIADQPDLTGASRPNSYVRMVTPDYFQTMGLDLTRGRSFSPSDRADGRPVVVVSQTLADRFWPGEDPLGRRIRTTFDDDWAEIVGVVEDVRMTGLRGPVPPVSYRPYPQIDFSPQSNMLVVRSDIDAAGVANAVRAEVASRDARVAVARVQTMSAVIRQSIAASLRLRFLLTLLGGLALFLGILGVYGMLSSSVRRQYRELGIRMALGASPRNVVAAVVGRGLLVTGIGIAVGLLGAVLLGRTFSSLLVGIEPTDPAFLLGVAATLAGAGVLAAWLPALRASRVDPMITLRAE